MQPPAGSQVSRVPAQRTPPDEVAPPPVVPSPPPPRNRAGVVVTLVVGLLAVLAVAGTAAGYLLYDRATAPDRSAPDVVVDNYLRAFLVDRDDTKASFFTCDEQGAELTQLTALRNDLQLREERLAVKIVVSWGRLKYVQSDNRAEVEVDLLFSAFVDGVSQNDRQSWRFSTRLDDVWQVCSGTPSI
ncbi:hypothetical protein ABT336_21570 [Micromonospora sp. NPDC000207]|uniref:hypothetical protein n=1 Tax=Micromonospora sp. NPDC000207 TaxID=3154246 RepID=UPI003323ADFE